MWAIPFAVVGLVLTILLPELPLRRVAHVGAGDTDHGESEPLSGAAVEI
jgi:hypothetical protein